MSRRFELLLLAFVWVVFLAFINAPGRSEGKFFPIMTNFSYEVSETVDVDASNVFLSFDKIRSDCAFRGVGFYLNEMQDGEVAQTVKLHAKFLGKEQGRFAGSHAGVGPWQIRATPEQLQNITIVFNHRCHAGFETITRYKILDGKVEKI